MPLLSAGWPALCPCRFGGDRVTKRARQASPRRAPLQSAMIAVDQAMLAAGNLCRSGNFVCRVLRVARIMETFQPSSQGHRRSDYGATRAQPPRRCCLPVEHARLSSFPSLLGLGFLRGEASARQTASAAHPWFRCAIWLSVWATAGNSSGKIAAAPNVAPWITTKNGWLNNKAGSDKDEH